MGKICPCQRTPNTFKTVLTDFAILLFENLFQFPPHAQHGLTVTVFGRCSVYSEGNVVKLRNGQDERWVTRKGSAYRGCYGCYFLFPFFESERLNCLIGEEDYGVPLPSNFMQSCWNNWVPPLPFVIIVIGEFNDRAIQIERSYFAM